MLKCVCVCVQLMNTSTSNYMDTELFKSGDFNFCTTQQDDLCILFEKQIPLQCKCPKLVIYILNTLVPKTSTQEKQSPYFDTLVGQCIDAVNKLMVAYPDKFKTGLSKDDSTICEMVKTLRTDMSKHSTQTPIIPSPTQQEMHTKAIDNQSAKDNDTKISKPVLMFSDKTMNIYSPRRTRHNKKQSSSHTEKSKHKQYSRVIHLSV